VIANFARAAREAGRLRDMRKKPLFYSVFARAESHARGGGGADSGAFLYARNAASPWQFLNLLPRDARRLVRHPLIRAQSLDFQLIPLDEVVDRARLWPRNARAQPSSHPVGPHRGSEDGSRARMSIMNFFCYFPTAEQMGEY
jgi:hypothetical protein